MTNLTHPEGVRSEDLHLTRRGGGGGVLLRLCPRGGLCPGGADPYR